MSARLCRRWSSSVRCARAVLVRRLTRGWACLAALRPDRRIRASSVGADFRGNNYEPTARNEAGPRNPERRGERPTKDRPNNQQQAGDNLGLFGQGRDRKHGDGAGAEDRPALTGSARSGLRSWFRVQHAFSLKKMAQRTSNADGFLLISLWRVRRQCAIYHARTGKSGRGQEDVWNARQPAREAAFLAHPTHTG